MKIKPLQITILGFMMVIVGGLMLAIGSYNIPFGMPYGMLYIIVMDILIIGGCFLIPSCVVEEESNPSIVEK
jgi:hypothetical protein